MVTPQKTINSTVFVVLAISSYIWLPSFIAVPFLGLVLLFGAFGFTTWEYLMSHKETPLHFKPKKKDSIKALDVLLATAALVAISVGGVITVDAISLLSKLLGYSTTVLGLSLTALSTTLPELITTIISQERNESKLMIGNIIGSLVYNLLLIGGINSLVLPPKIVGVEIAFLVLSTMALVSIVTWYKGKVVPKIIDPLPL